jgi:cysteine desulfurase family protein (TIGR01976 family)
MTAAIWSYDKVNFNLDQIRAQFPALHGPVLFLDNPGGTQIVQSSLDQIQRYLVECNANHGGNFATSRISDARVHAARTAMAEFLNAKRPEEIIFGQNMTSLTFSISRALGRTFKPGDTLVVTRLDHDANVSPWLQVAEDRGCKIRWVDFHTQDCTLDLDDLGEALKEKPRLVAVGYASNATGTVNPVKEITQMAHAAGALVYIDAVQYAPHGPIDVQDLGCDFLVCSAYKFFGPHLGILYGRYDLLEQLTAYKVRPSPVLPPNKFETGTGNFEHMCGLNGALDYFLWIGENFGQDWSADNSSRYSGRSLIFKNAMRAIHEYELTLSQALLENLLEVPGLTLYGIADEQRLNERVPTFSFTLKGWTPAEVAEKMGDQQINLWDGNFYALAVTERLGLEEHGGLVRVGATHYNTAAEIRRFGEALQNIRKG